MTWRRTVSVIAGVVAAGLVMMVIEGLGVALFPLPVGVDPDDGAQLATAMEAGQVPLGALVMVVVAWAVAAFVGGLLAGYLGETERVRIGLATGGVLTVLALVNLAQIPHPVWMMVCGVVLWLPLAAAGALASVHLPADPRDEAT